MLTDEKCPAGGAALRALRRCQQASPSKAHWTKASCEEFMASLLRGESGIAMFICRDALPSIGITLMLLL